MSSRSSLLMSALLLLLSVLTLTHGHDAADAQTVATSFVRTLECRERPGIVTDTSSPFNPVATFNIPSVGESGVGDSIQQVWIDLSLFNNNFAPNTYLGVGPFNPANETQRFEWQELLAASRHYYRLNALTPAGWREIGRARSIRLTATP